MAVEAYYAGYIRTAHIQNDTVVTPCGANVTVIINAISVAHDNTAVVMMGASSMSPLATTC